MNRINSLLISVAAGAVLCGCSRNDVVIDGDDLSKEALAAAESSGYKPPMLTRDTLRICAWEDFFAPDVVASFEKALGVKVTVESFESNEEIFEKIKAGEGDYDLLTPSSYIIPSMADAGLVTKLNHLHLPNVRKNFDTRLKPLLVDPRMTYNVPYSVSYTLIHCDKSQIPAGADPSDYSIFSHPALKGRTALFDDIRETLGLGLMHLGYSINSSNPAEINAAADQVIKWKLHAGRSDDAFYDGDIRSGKLAVAMSYSYLAYISLARDRSECAKGVVESVQQPKGNFSLAVDEFVVVASSRHKRLAYAFINYIYDENVASSSMKSRFSSIPVRPAFDKLSPELRKQVVLSPEMMKRGQVIMGFNNRPKVEKLYESAWERVKAAQ